MDVITVSGKEQRFSECFFSYLVTNTSRHSIWIVGEGGMGVRLDRLMVHLHFGPILPGIVGGPDECSILVSEAPISAITEVASLLLSGR